METAIIAIYFAIVLIHWIVITAGTGLKNVIKGGPGCFEYIARLIGGIFWPLVWLVEFGKVLWFGWGEFKKRG